MKTIGFVISHKNTEQRRALLPDDLVHIRHPRKVFVETGYGESVGARDKDYAAFGVHVVPRAEALRCDVITDVKLGDADFLGDIENGKTLFGWAHAVQMTDFTEACIRGGHTVIAWEEIHEDGRYVFYRNREVAGEAAILHGFRYCGRMPYDARVAVIGNGQTAKGALRILHGLGAQVDVYGRKFEQLFRKKMFEYDVLVNCVMWDTSRTDRIIYRKDLKKMRPGTLIIDVSCDPELEIETSRPTTIDDPVYVVDGVIHYAVDNTPAMYPKTVSRLLSAGISKMTDRIIEGRLPPHVRAATVIKDGKILRDEITHFRQARGLYCGEACGHSGKDAEANRAAQRQRSAVRDAT